MGTRLGPQETGSWHVYEMDKYVKQTNDDQDHSKNEQNEKYMNTKGSQKLEKD